ncbi:MAG TPA: LeuA family protein [Vicinamibacterales bacterium]|jgi:2-isopropylmalate synthase
MQHSLIYDWNRIGRPQGVAPIALDDETLRDGLQSPSVCTPSIDQKIEILHLIDGLRIDTADIGLPGAGPHVVRDVERLAREIAESRLRVAPNCAARTVIADIVPIVEISQRVGIPIECCAFIGSSPIRQYAEDWTIEWLERRTDEAIGFAVREGLKVMYVTEDTTRADPDSLRRMFLTAIRAGATRLCIADTVGYATPAGTRAVVQFVASVIKESGADIGIDWHGHRDRDLAIANCLAAIDAGATRLHGSALGVGERVGNAPMDTLLVNLVLEGYIERDLTTLPAYCEAVSRACGLNIPANYPVIGSDAFRTATGVHAAAVVKAFRKGEPDLVDSVYSAVPASMVGRGQLIEIGPMSGKWNVVFWLEQHGFTPDERLVDRIFLRAKQATRTLTLDEIRAIIAEVPAARPV